MTVTSLTPPLAQALFDPPGAGASDAVRAALLHLVTLGHLGTQVEERKVLRATRRVVLLHRRESSAPVPPELAVVLEALFPLSAPVKPLAPAEVMQRLQKGFGVGYGRYLAAHLRPVPGLLERDPRRALGIVAGLDALVVLQQSLRPHLGAIAEAARAHGATGVPAPDLLPALEDDDERRTAWMDALEMLSSLDRANVLDAVDSLGDAFDGGADGGGDGGGGGGE